MNRARFIYSRFAAKPIF